MFQRDLSIRISKVFTDLMLTNHRCLMLMTWTIRLIPILDHPTARDHRAGVVVMGGT